MKFLIQDIKLPIDYTDEEAICYVKERYLPKGTVTIHKKSLDARKKEVLLFVYTFLAEADCIPPKLKKKAVPYHHTEPTIVFGNEKLANRPVIVGAGPAGLFCAYLLAKNGYAPIILERGEPIEERTKTVNRFFSDGNLNEDSNVQFGEGGAGAFSDGKLTCRINDPLARTAIALLSEHSGLPELSYQAKPHIGTDRLQICVKSLREEIQKLGGEFRFGAKLTDFTLKNGVLCGVTVNETDTFSAEALVLATGHSAKDIYRMAHQKGLSLIPKAFSVGARVEHFRSVIDEIQYGSFAGHPNLGAADYQVFHHCKNGHTAYSFCMCPGGVVVPSQSEHGTVVANGMSYLARDGKNSNSALCVSVSGEDFGIGLWDGVNFIERLEQAAYQLAGNSGKAPVTTVEALTGIAPSGTLPESTYALGVNETDFHALFPQFVTESLTEGLMAFERKLHGFVSKGAILTGVETRTSAPLRILRNDTFQADAASGIYPCGEGAGYAGGIVSAAVDGMKVAMKLMEQYAPLR